MSRVRKQFVGAAVVLGAAAFMALGPGGVLFGAGFGGIVAMWVSRDDRPETP